MANVYDILTVEEKQYYRMDKNVIAESDVPEEIKKVLTPTNVVDDTGHVIVDEKAAAAQEPSEENLAQIEKQNGGTKLTPRNQKPTAGTEEKPADGNGNDSEPDDDTEDDDDEDDTPIDLSEQNPEPASAPAPEPAPEPKPVAPAPAGPAFKSSVPQSRPGMGFPRFNGKTTDIFDGRTPHTHLKNVGGIMVPLSQESFNTKSDAQIIEKLRELGMSPIDFAAIQAQESTQESRAGNGPNSVLLDESEGDDTPFDQ